MPSAPSNLTLVIDPYGNKHPILGYTDSNQGIAHVMSKWVISSNNVLLPEPLDSNNIPQVSVGGQSGSALGTVGDTATIDPSASASMIALLKGLLTQLEGNGTGQVPASSQYLVSGGGAWKTAGEDNPMPMRQYGDSSVEAYDLLAQMLTGNQTQKTLQFTAPQNHLTIINDGTTDMKFAIGQNVVNEVNQNDASFSYYPSSWGTGAVTEAYDGDYQGSNTPGNYFTINPGVNVTNLGVLFITGPGAGIVDFTVSQDGTTWVTPSSVTGMTREDGVTGTNMDTFDLYTAGQTFTNVTFQFPEASTWQVRATIDSNHNASSSNYAINVDAAFWELPGVAVRVKAGEVWQRYIQATTVNYRSVSGVPAIRIEGMS